MPPRACPPVAAAPAARTPELSTPFSTFHSIPPPRHFLQKTETTRTCLKETAHLLALKGTAVAQRGAGIGDRGSAALWPPLAFSGSLPPAAPRHRPGLVRSLRSGQIPSSPLRAGRVTLPPASPHPSGLFWCHVDEIIRLGFSGGLLSLLVSLTQRISQMRLGKKNSGPTSHCVFS